MSLIYKIKVAQKLKCEQFSELEAVYKSKCASCHGPKASKSALNKSQIIAGWDAQKIIQSIADYKEGKGGPLKGTMKPIATGLSDDDVKAVAATIASYK